MNHIRALHVRLQLLFDSHRFFFELIRISQIASSSSFSMKPKQYVPFACTCVERKTMEETTRDRKEKANHTQNGEKHDWILCRVQLNEIDMI